MGPGQRRRSGCRTIATFLLALAGAAAGTAVRAQDVPQVISPLRVEADHNSVNLVTGRTVIDLPVLSVPGAPNLRFDRVQNAAPYVSGRVQNQASEPGYDRRSYSVHTGGGSSESFQCIDFDCESVTGSGSTFVANSRTYRQAGTGALWHFTLKHVHTTGANQTLLYYASSVVYPNGETLSYEYESVTPAGDPLGRVFHRPTTITSNLGYSIGLTYQSAAFGSDEWGQVAVATIYANADANTPLGRLTYGVGGTIITDLGGRVFSCSGCTNQLGIDLEVGAGLTQLPGEAAPAMQATLAPGSGVVGAVTRDGVQWTYAYDNLRVWEYTGAWLYDRVTVSGPDGFHNVYDMATYAASPFSRGSLITRATDSIGRSTSYHYDESQRPVRIVYPELNEILVGYDARGNISWRIAKAKPGSGLADIEETVEFLTDTCTGVLCYRPSWSRDALGRQTDYAYNALGQLIEQIDPADANGVRRKTMIAYATSAAGVSRRSAVRICGLGTTCGTSAEIRTEYDYWGETFLPSVERRIDAVEGVTLETHYAYDAAGRLLSADGPLPGTGDAVYSRYDQYGRKTWEIGASGTNGVRLATRTAYRDSDDKPLVIETGTLPDASSTNLTILRRTDLAYDSRRNPIRETVSASGTAFTLVQRTFDDRGRLDCEARRMNPAAFAAPPPSACTPGTAGAQGPDRITRNLYDAAGQRLQLRDGVGTGVEAADASWAYGANGQVATVIDANGNRAELRYDGHGRQDRWTFPSATRAAAFDDSTPATALATAGAVNAADYEEYAYDAAGNRTSLRKRDGSTLTYQYDALNRMIVKVVPERAGLAPVHTRDVYYGYDLRGLQTYARFDSPAGEGVTFAYDGFGRRLTETGPLGTMSSAWDAGGRRTLLTGPGSYRQGYAYLETGAMSALLNGNGDPVAAFAYDGSERRQSFLLFDNSGATSAYDALDRLSQLNLNLAGTASDLTLDFTRNPAGQIAGATRSNDAYAWTGHYAVERPYTANGLNQYSAAGAAAFAYDANGNLISDGATAFAYDVENRLVGAAGARNATLTYDPLGRLYEVAAGGVTRRFAYDGDALIGEFDGAGAVRQFYVHGPGVDEPLIWFDIAAGAYGTYLADERGSVVALAGNTSAVPAINRYDEYGIPAATNAGRFQYTGQMWLPELGMYYYKARIYSPTLGRFLQVDPIGYDDQFNLYGYVGNDPVNNADPTGMEQESCTGSRIPCPKGGLSPGRSGTSSGDNRRGSGRGHGGGGGGGDEDLALDRGSHFYNEFMPACEVGECTETQVFNEWRMSSAPGAPYARDGTHNVTLSGNNPIEQTVSPRARAIVNRTREGHVFHKGSVMILVRTENGRVGARVIGWGSRGAHHTWNRAFGLRIFRLLGGGVRGRIYANHHPPQLGD